MSTYDYEALWMKAKLFANRALEADRPFDEAAFWACSSLELLGKAALAKASPVLIAEPTESGENLMIALGLIGGDSTRFVTVKAATIWRRCSLAFRPFSLKDAVTYSEARNEYLHGSGVAFDAIPQSAWWARFWSLAAVLVSALDREIEDLVGMQQATVVESHLAQNTRNFQHRYEARIDRARQRIALRESPYTSAQVLRELASLGAVTGVLGHSTTGTCPACDNVGSLEGDGIIKTNVEWHQIDFDEFEPEVTLTIEAEYFGCQECGLVLDHWELLRQSDLPGEFEVEGDPSDAYEPEYGNE